MAVLNTELGSNALPLLRDLQVGSLSLHLRISLCFAIGAKPCPALYRRHDRLWCASASITADLPDIETLKQSLKNYLPA